MIVNRTINGVMHNLRADGATYRDIAQSINIRYDLNISHTTVRYHIDSDYRANERVRAWRNRRKPRRPRPKGGKLSRT